MEIFKCTNNYNSTFPALQLNYFNKYFRPLKQPREIKSGIYPPFLLTKLGIFSQKGFLPYVSTLNIQYIFLPPFLFVLTSLFSL